MEGVMADEFDDGKRTFLHLVKSIDAAVEVVIPVTPSRGSFLIALSKDKARKFMSVAEDDILDLPEDPAILAQVTAEVKAAISGLSGV
jgi:hypothetical protein